MELTAQQAYDIRRADLLCFDHRPDGEAYIRAIFDDDTSEITVKIPVERSRVDVYDGSTGPYSCFHMEHTPQYNEDVRTAVRDLRQGSELAFVWTRGDSSPVTEAAGLVVDKFRLRVRKGGVTNTYLLRVSVGRDNTARMIKTA